MSSSYQIDGGSVKDPISFNYDELYQAGKDWMGIFVTSSYFSGVAQFNTLQKSEYSAWSAADDGATHTITIPKPNDPSTFATYSGVSIRCTSAGISNGLYFYGSQFKVTKIGYLGLAVFGA